MVQPKSVAGDGPDIEAHPRLPRRFESFWLALYPVAWVLLFSVSTIYWFLPAGLRLATLWLLPRRAWWKMALAEWAGILALSLARDGWQSVSGIALSTLLPWCAYALVIAAARVHEADLPVRKALPRLLGCGLVAALLNTIGLTAIDLYDDGILAGGVRTMLASQALGDFAGIVVTMPLVLALAEQFGPNRRDLAALSARGFVLAPVAIALGLAGALPVRAPVYPLLYSLLPLFAVAYRYGWRAAAIAAALLGIGAHGVSDALAQIWNPGEMQLLIAVTTCAALLLGVAAETQWAQRSMLSATVQALSWRTTQLSEAASRIASLQEKERRRIGAELHDQLGQDMTAIATRLRVVERTASEPAVRDGLASIGGLVADAHTHLREVINHLHPAVLDRFGLARALAEGPLAELLRDQGVHYSCAIEGDVDALPDPVASALYRICQEVLTNCARHGCGGYVHLQLSLVRGAASSALALRVADGAGAIEIPAHGTGHGLQNIRDRADALGAEYWFDPASGRPRHALRLWVPHPAGDQSPG